MRTNAGADFFNTQLFGTGANTPDLWVALTSNATAPAAADTTLTGEITTNGLARALATVTHTAGSGTATVSIIFTYTGSVAVTINKCGLFTASAGGTMVYETLPTPAQTVSANGDTLTLTWTINF